VLVMPVLWWRRIWGEVRAGLALGPFFLSRCQRRKSAFWTRAEPDQLRPVGVGRPRHPAAYQV